MTMLRRIWRAFWTAMREPVRAYAPDKTLTLRVDVDDTEAQAKLQRLLEKADALRQAGEWRL